VKGGEGDEEVDAARDQDSREEREREGADGILRLLRDVGRVLEADQGIESERRPGENREKRAVALLELEVSPDVAVPGAQDPEADRDDDQEPGKLDHREHHVRPDRRRDAAKVHQRDEDDEGEGGERGRNVHELLQVVAAEGP